MIASLLFYVTEGCKLLFYGGVIPFTGFNHLYQRTVFNSLHRNLTDVGFQLLVKFFDPGNLIVCQLQMLDNRILGGQGRIGDSGGESAKRNARQSRCQ